MMEFETELICLQIEFELKYWVKNLIRVEKTKNLSKIILLFVKKITIENF